MNSNHKTLGIAITCSEPERFSLFKSCLNSLLSQKLEYEQIHVVFSNNSSFHKHVALIESNQNSKVTYHISEDSLNPRAARYASLDYLNTDYIQFIDDDDLLFPWACEYLTQTINNTEHDAIFFGITETKEADEAIKLGYSDGYKVSYVKDPITQLGDVPTSMVLRCVKKSIYLDHIATSDDLELEFAEDYYDSVLLFRHAQNCSYIDAKLYIYRAHNLQSIRQNDKTSIIRKINNIDSVVTYFKTIDFGSSIDATYVVDFTYANLANFFFNKYHESQPDLVANEIFRLLNAISIDIPLVKLPKDLNKEYLSKIKTLVTYTTEPVVMNNNPHPFKPEVTIIIPLYNKEEYVIETIESCLKQTVVDLIKIYVIDDCSTDNGLNKVILKYSENSQITILKNEINLGLGLTRNRGINLCETEFVYFLDSDDVLDSCAIETALATAKIDNADVVVCNFSGTSGTNLPSTTFLPTNRGKLSYIQYMLEHKFVMSACSRLYRTSHLIDNDIKFTDLYHEDTSFIFEAVFKARAVANQSRSVYKVRPVAGSISRQLTPQKIVDYLKQYDIIFSIIEKSEFMSMLYPSWRAGRIALVDKLIVRVMLFSKDAEAAVSNRKALYDYIEMENINPQTLKGYNNKWFKLSDDDFSAYFEAETGTPEKSTSSDCILTPELYRNIVPSTKKTIAIVADVNYHVDNAIEISIAIRKTGLNCIIFDKSKTMVGGKRQFSGNASGVTIIDWESKWYESYLTDLAAVMYFNTHGEGAAHEIGLLQRNNIFIFGIVEGITDYLNKDTFRYSRPYLNTDCILVPAIQDRQELGNYHRNVIRVGNAKIRKQVDSKFTRKMKVLVNLNFSYGVKESRASEWIYDVKTVSEDLGIEIIVSRHPMDGSLKWHDYNLKTTDKSFYEILSEVDVCISRFGTAIIESQAEGVPVIYYDSIDENVSRFKDLPTESSAAYRCVNKKELKKILIKLKNNYKEKLSLFDTNSDYLRKSIRYGDILSTANRIAKVVETEIFKLNYVKAKAISNESTTIIENYRIDSKKHGSAIVVSSERSIRKNIFLNYFQKLGARNERKKPLGLEIDKKKVELSLNGLTIFSFSLTASDFNNSESKYSHTWPPMPMLCKNGNIFIFQESETKLRLSNRSNPRAEINVININSIWNFQLVCKEGFKNILVYSGYELLGVLETNEPVEDFEVQLGLGFNQREWTGTINFIKANYFIED